MNMEWRNITPSNDPKFFVRGTELNSAIVPGTLSRFKIVEIRSLATDGFPDRRYAIRDAASVSDQMLRDGVKPKIVKWFDDEKTALEWCREQL